MEPRWKINKTPEKVRLWWKINKTPPWVSPAVVARNPAVVGILQWRSEISQPSSDATRFFSPFLGSESRKGRPKRWVPSRWHPGVDPKIWVIFLPGGGAKLWYRNSRNFDVLWKNIQQQNVGTTIPKNRVAISAQLFVFQLFVCFSSGGVNNHI